MPAISILTTLTRPGCSNTYQAHVGGIWILAGHLAVVPGIPNVLFYVSPRCFALSFSSLCTVFQRRGLDPDNLRANHYEPSFHSTFSKPGP
ncbi:MAG: hypothetical protein C7B43_08370 [Sulfobacillus benefaciens]|uniref:Uncharacterized protein n=1 Tax=Sulfobacillus benefaciens TaxID=453960 RepID=A0A2T2X4H9_9FIRM|nr:MAG: hypothetical protein C7B43_08370 [Sulfobacillus benefaciens]HBQ95085.1 hypothetical protein [Sulfobacillus sp.]